MIEMHNIYPCKDINLSIKEYRQKKWLETLDKCQAGSKRLRDTIKNIRNPKKSEDTFNGDPKKLQIN